MSLAMEEGQLRARFATLKTRRASRLSYSSRETYRAENSEESDPENKENKVPTRTDYARMTQQSRDEVNYAGDCRERADNNSIDL